MELVKLPPEILAAGGLDPSQDSPDNVNAFGQMLGTAFLPIDMGYPSLRVQNIDPPVLTCDNFLSAEVCEAMLAAAKQSGHMKASQVGGIGDLSTDIRTSSTLAITKDVLTACPDLQQPLQQLLDAAQQLVGQGLDTSALRDMQFVRPSSCAQSCHRSHTTCQASTSWPTRTASLRLPPCRRATTGAPHCWCTSTTYHRVVPPSLTTLTSGCSRSGARRCCSSPPSQVASLMHGRCTLQRMLRRAVRSGCFSCGCAQGCLAAHPSTAPQLLPVRWQRRARGLAVPRKSRRGPTRRSGDGCLWMCV